MIKRNLPLVITILVFIIGYLICLVEFPAFASTRVICNILTDNAFLGIVAVGMTFVILSGGIDLSAGAGMGWLIHTLKIPPFIITLAGMFFLRGTSFLISEQSLPITHLFFRELSRSMWKIAGGGRLSLLAVIILAVVIIGIFVAHRTRFGNNVYAIGGMQFPLD
jgi:simple sugar transport system permease protein